MKRNLKLQNKGPVGKGLVGGMMKKWSLLAGFTLLANGCAGGAESTPVVASPSNAVGGGGKADIYGEDNRTEPWDALHWELASVAQSTAALMRSNMIVESSDGETFNEQGQTLGQRYNLCPDVRFREQQASAFCTAFLIAPDLVATAGHCVETQEECESVHVVFGYEYDDEYADAPRIRARDVFRCERLEVQVYETSGLDYALLRLEREVTHRPTALLNTENELEFGANIGIVGHPSGLPMKVAGGSTVQGWRGPLAVTTLDTYGGHSGSPIVNMDTGLVEGIHVRGTKDYVETEAGCKVDRTCEELSSASGCVGNRFTPVKRFIEAFNPFL